MLQRCVFKEGRGDPIDPCTLLGRTCQAGVQSKLNLVNLQGHPPGPACQAGVQSELSWRFIFKMTLQGTRERRTDRRLVKGIPPYYKNADPCFLISKQLCGGVFPRHTGLIFLTNVFLTSGVGLLQT